MVGYFCTRKARIRWRSEPFVMMLKVCRKTWQRDAVNK